MRSYFSIFLFMFSLSTTDRRGFTEITLMYKGVENTCENGYVGNFTYISYTKDNSFFYLVNAFLQGTLA